MISPGTISVWIRSLLRALCYEDSKLEDLENKGDHFLSEYKYLCFDESMRLIWIS